MKFKPQMFFWLRPCSPHLTILDSIRARGIIFTDRELSFSVHNNRMTHSCYYQPRVVSVGVVRCPDKEHMPSHLISYPMTLCKLNNLEKLISFFLYVLTMTYWLLFHGSF